MQVPQQTAGAEPALQEQVDVFGRRRPWPLGKPREAPLNALAKNAGGGSYRLIDSTPDVRRTRVGDRQQGGGWLGLVRNDSGRLIGVREEPLLPPWAAWGLLTALLAAAWWRERV